ncbi:MAG: tetratricopeptide repeat protein, partial [Nitrososphaera sp.]|nr:tetratricopeptide repeat protein [Nitrososphaera sp.]
TKAPPYHAKSLHHLAEMQYLQGRPAEAYDNIQKALCVTPNDHDTMYDAARYAAKTGREPEALELLDKCIELQPQTTIVMFSEEDFVS